MTDNPGRDPADDGPHAMPHVRDAQDADDHAALDKDPTNAEAITDIANDESFPASDPPSHAAPNQGEPAISSGYDEKSEAMIARQRVSDARVEEDEPHLTETEASGGKKLGTMRYVLGLSLVAIILIFAVMLLLNR
jgi:hypothetical protein